MLVALFVDSSSPTNLHLDFGHRLINIYGNDVEKNISLMLIDETLMQKNTQFANNDGNQCSMVVHQQLSLNTILNECRDDAGTSVQV